MLAALTIFARGSQGPTRFIQIHLEMEDSLPLVQAHMVADQVEQAILRRFPGSDVIIHQDPLFRRTRGG